MGANKRILLIISFSAVLLSACNSGSSTAQPDNSPTTATTSSSRLNSASSYYFNCSANSSETCNNGKNIVLKNGASGNRQGLKLMAPTLGSSVVKLVIQDAAGQAQTNVVFYPSKTTIQNCDFSKNQQCSLTVDASNGIAGKALNIVALDTSDNKLATIGVTVNNGSGVTPPPANNWGSFTVNQAVNLAKMTPGQSSSFTITLDNSQVNDNNVSIPLSFDFLTELASVNCKSVLMAFEKL